MAERLNSSSSKSEKMDESESKLEVCPKSMLSSMVSSGEEKSYGVGMVLDIGCC